MTFLPFIVFSVADVNVNDTALPQTGEEIVYFGTKYEQSCPGDAELGYPNFHILKQ